MTEQQRQQQQQQHGAMGVRAEPVFIRGPSTLESLSSVLTGVSSYVANTLPTSFSMPARGFPSPSSPAFGGNPTNPYYYPTVQGSTNPLLGTHQDNVCVLTNGDVVVFSAFDWIESGNNAKNRAPRRFCLLLGYADGFQIWDITHPDNIHEIFSLRTADNEVSFIKVLPSPRVPSGKVDQFEQHRPLVAVISNGKDEDGRSSPKKLQIYSLASLKVIKTLDFGEGPDYDISAMDVNERGLVVAMTAPGEGTRLFLLNQLTLNPLHPKQTVLNDAAYPGVFDLGTRLLAYVTTSEAPTETADSKHGENEPEAGGGYQDLAKGVAKEVFGGVRMLGGFAHQTISSYWSGSPMSGPATSTSPPVQSGMNRSPNRHARRPSSSIDHDRPSAHAPHRRRHDDNSPNKKEAVGTVIVRDISLANMPIVAHFKPHDHHITRCKFSPSGRLLLTVSRHGNVFHIHEVRPTMGPGSRHIYKLARGITHASVEDIVFNEDETWVAVTTSRGTTHLYAINPFGGSPDVGAHMYTGIVNWTATAIEYPTSLNALCRIKQRHHVPEVIISEEYNMDSSDFQATLATERRRGSLHRQNSQDSLSSSGTGTSEHSHGNLSRLQQHHSTTDGGRQRAMISAYFLPSSTVFASDSAHVAPSPGEYEGSAEGPLGQGAPDHVERESSPAQASQAHSSALLIHRSKAPPVSTTAKLQSTASNLWQTLSPPAAAVMQHAAHGLASLPGFVVETSRRGPVATVRSRTMSWAGSNGSSGTSRHHQPASQDSHNSGMSNGTQSRGVDTHKNNVVNDSQAPLAVQQQLASQGSLVEPERSPSFADIYVFNPLGILTLHRCWVSSVRSKKTFNGRVVETSDLVLTPEDVAEWTLNRSGDWAPVLRSLAPPPTPKMHHQAANKVKKTTFGSTGHTGSRWLTHAEISTYDNGMNSGWKGQYPLLNQTLAAQGSSFASTVTLTQPQHLLWKSPQFSFQTYVGSIESIQQEFADGKQPATMALNLRRGVDFVAGKDRRSSKDASVSHQPSSKHWVSGIAVSGDGRGVRGHGRVESQDGDTEDLSENLSSAMKSYLQTHSSSPINQSRMSPSGGSISPSSFRATLSFEDAYLIHSGNASGSPKPTFVGVMNQPSPYAQQTFLSTPPAEQGTKLRQSSLAGTSPGSSAAIHHMATYSNTPSSSTSPMISSFGDSNNNFAGSVGSKSHLLGPSGHHSHHVQALGFNNTGASPLQGSPRLSPHDRSTQPGTGTNPMAQSTVMMFSPDGDNEVDMPGSASVFIGANANDQLAQETQRNGGHHAQDFTLSHGGVFHLDDDDFYTTSSDALDGDSAGLSESKSNGRYAHHQDVTKVIDDDYDDGSF
ncbi:hypothetical protein BG011_007414 [Mortierella polycephala]|uniref:BCAS3 WD40 domain-containing protein n=1 Tax=Mortierella polycephala TaxID=41804 RepID=A0A9P6U8U0_9FUNG|nr:hypothetical protein BG011_007414 [Mortierella polycephala]